MSGSGDIKEDLPIVDQATLKMLSVLEEGDNVTQRELALRIGVALGFANKLIKRAVSKGLLKVSEAPAKRYAYYLTPKGFAEKSRLVGDYLTTSLQFFKRARLECELVFAQIKKDNRRSVALYGVSELAEIAVMAAQVGDLKPVMVVQEGAKDQFFSGLSIVTSLKSAKDLGIDAIMICQSVNAQAAFFCAREFFEDEQIYAPAILRITRKHELSIREI